MIRFAFLFFFSCSAFGQTSGGVLFQCPPGTYPGTTVGVCTTTPPAPSSTSSTSSANSVAPTVSASYDATINGIAGFPFTDPPTTPTQQACILVTGNASCTLNAPYGIQSNNCGGVSVPGTCQIARTYNGAVFSTETLVFSVVHPASCPTGYTFNPGSGQCDPPISQCVNAPPISGDYISVGGMPSSLCVNGCQYNAPATGFSGYSYGPLSKRTSMLSGISKLPSTGNSCTGSDSTAIPIPKTSCSATQSMISMGGQTKCIDATMAASAVAAANAASGVGTASQVDPALAKSADTLANNNQGIQDAVNAARQAASAAGLGQSGMDAAGAIAAGTAAQKSTDPNAASGVGSDMCANNPNSLACLDTTNIPTSETLKTSNVDFSTFAFNQYSFSTNGACPAPKQLTALGRPYSFSYQPACDFFSWFRPVALAVSMLLGSMILLGQRTSGGDTA